MAKSYVADGTIKIIIIIINFILALKNATSTPKFKKKIKKNIGMP